jgi:hypothetical protein
MLTSPAATVSAVKAAEDALVAASSATAVVAPSGQKPHAEAKSPSPPASCQCGLAPACAAAGRAYAALDRPAEAVAHMLMVGGSMSTSGCYTFLPAPPVPCIVVVACHACGVVTAMHAVSSLPSCATAVGS